MVGSNKAWLWIAGGLALSLGLFMSPLASQQKDGLDANAERLGLQESPSSPAKPTAPLPAYQIPAVASPYWSTGLAGLIGTAAVFLVTTGLVKLIARNPPTPAAVPASANSLAREPLA